VGTTGGRGRNRGRRRSSQIRLAGNYHFVCAFRFSLFISAFVFPLGSFFSVFAVFFANEVTQIWITFVALC